MANESQGQQRQPAQYSAVRRWTRYPVSLSLRVRVPTTAGEEFMLAHGRDMSQGGMAVYVPVELEVGQTVFLQLIFPRLHEPVTLFGTVKNRTGFMYGVEFRDPTPEQQGTILMSLHSMMASKGAS
jgi:hypothetical protein